MDSSRHFKSSLFVLSSLFSPCPTLIGVYYNFKLFTTKSLSPLVRNSLGLRKIHTCLVPFLTTRVTETGTTRALWGLTDYWDNSHTFEGKNNIHMLSTTVSLIQRDPPLGHLGLILQHTLVLGKEESTSHSTILHVSRNTIPGFTSEYVHTIFTVEFSPTPQWLLTAIKTPGYWGMVFTKCTIGWTLQEI